ncbi:MAG: TonB-dependent receptor [Acidobacteriales bacterium]|nr:TonB-dependent receptor [Terriglobales bacterium]
MAFVPAFGQEPDDGHARSGDTPESVLFDDIPPVETATLYARTLEQAPARVTVVTEHEIRRHGYRTLGEALDSAAGFHVTSDGVQTFVGVRGFNLPGDYCTRILVLVNGHYLTDDIYAAMYMFGEDFGIDMSLVERIEIVRGPTSALYGSNGVFATINIFTRPPAESDGTTVSTTAGSHGVRKGVVTTSAYLGRGANLLLSAAGYHNSGRTLEVPGFGSTGNVDATQGYRTFAHLTWKDWSVIASFADNKALGPAGYFCNIFGDPGTSSRDAHSFIEASWTRPIGKDSSLNWRFYYDQFRYRGRYDSLDGDGSANDRREFATGDWVGTRLSYQTPVHKLGTLTIGGQFDADIRNLQRDYEVDRPNLLLVDTNKRNQSYALFAQQEWNLTSRWTLFAGFRLDDSRLNAAFVSPRVAAVYKASPKSSYKFIYGRAFRNPSTYERYWSPSPLLVAEKIHSFEFVREKDLTPRISAAGSVYYYRLNGLIEGVPISESILQYRNQRDSWASGLDVEMKGRATEWLELSASFSVQEARYKHGKDLPNFPDRLAKFRAAVPLFRDRLSLAMAGRYHSASMAVDGEKVAGAVVADLTINTNRLHPQLDLQFGIRNLADRRYYDPISEEHSMLTLLRPGRTVFLRIEWRPGI